MIRHIDAIIAAVRGEIPDVNCTQLKVKYPGVDDDGIWFFQLPGTSGEVQAESSYGMCPFVVETTASNLRVEGETPESTAALIVQRLRELPRD